MRHVRHLGQLSARDTLLAGGKGANLGELAQAGLPVPPGFVLATGAYRAFVRANDLEKTIARGLEGIDLDDVAQLERAAALIAERFIAGRLPESIANELRRAYAALGGVPVAVRSSATVEDLPDASSAGQQETFLNVLGEGPLQEAVKRCWASLWTARAMAYRARRGLSQSGVSMAVVVQQMIDAEASGVLFTVNPATGDRGEMFVDASLGPGEGVVSGEVRPEEIVVDRRRWRVRRRSGACGRVLSDAQAVQLARLGERIQARFGRPQDVEWAWAGGRFHILQARPVTGLVRPQLTWEPPVPGNRYLRGGMMELLPEPVSVLFETLGLPAFEQAIKECQQRIVPGRAVEEWQDWGLVTVNGYVYGRVGFRLRMLPSLLLSLPAVSRFAAQAVEERHDLEALRQYRQAVESLAQSPDELGRGELLRRIEGLALACGRYWAVFAAMVPRLDQAERRFAMVCRWLAGKEGPKPAVFLRGLESRPLEAERALHAARDEEFEGYIARYGHALYTLDFSVPLAGEDRAALQAMRRAWRGGAPAPGERNARLVEEREEATRRVRDRLGSCRRRLFDRSLVAAQQAAQIRENMLFDLGLAWVPLRRHALALGRRLVESGALARPEQVFWLRREELASLSEHAQPPGPSLPPLAERAQRRQQEREAARGARAPFTIPERRIRGLASLFVPAAGARRQAGEDVLTGTATSPGRVTGVARVIAGPEQFDRLGRGEILVAHAATPAWTPLFALAGGLVADLGGALSHGSIIAREYGIPAVMGTGNGTERIRDGELITVDGAAGAVYLGPR